MKMRLMLLGAFLACVGLSTAQASQEVAGLKVTASSSDTVRPPSIAAASTPRSIVPADTSSSAGDIVESRPLPSVLYSLETPDDELGKTATASATSNLEKIAPVVAAAPAIIPGTENLSAEELFTHARELYGNHNFTDAFPLYRQAANLGHVEAQYMTGLMLYRGEGVAMADTKEAAHYYQMAADKGFSKAQYNLAILYYDGAGVVRDDTQAYKWLYLSSLQGEPRALKMLPVAQRNLKEEQKATAVAQAEMIRR